MNRRNFVQKSAAATAVAVSVPYIARGATPLTMKFAHFAALEHPANIAAKQFVDRVSTRTKGAIAITVYPNNQLGDPTQQAAQIKAGVIDMGLPTEGQLDKYDKAFAAVELPFVFDSRAEVFKVLDGPGIAWLGPLAEKQGFITLHNWDYGFRNVTNSVRPINTPDDMKGLKIRTPPEIQIEAAMEALGAIVTPISFAELYLALSQHVVDGEENPVSVIYYNKYNEVQKHLALTRHVYNNMILTVSAMSWPKLTTAQQTIFREESASAGDLMRKLTGDQEKDQIAKLQAAGMQVTTPDLAPFRAKMGPAYKRVSDYAGPEAVAKFLAMVKSAKA